MTRLRPERTPARALALLVCLAAVLIAAALAAAATLAACGSSASSSDASPSPVKTAIVKVLPRDASVEPPWNGRFVQVNVRVPDASAMDPADWHVTVNGKQPELDRAPSILPFSSSEATVAFMFRTPYTDTGAYRFRVAYTPKDGQKAEQAWEYTW